MQVPGLTMRVPLVERNTKVWWGQDQASSTQRLTALRVPYRPVGRPPGLWSRWLATQQPLAPGPPEKGPIPVLSRPVAEGTNGPVQRLLPGR
jgi:hypothetical protein